MSDYLTNQRFELKKDYNGWVDNLNWTPIEKIIQLHSLSFWFHTDILAIPSFDIDFAASSNNLKNHQFKLVRSKSLMKRENILIVRTK